MFLYITTLVTLIGILIIVAVVPETFSNTPLLVLRTERSPVNIVITNAKDNDVSSILSVDHISTVSSCKNCYLKVVDFFSVVQSPLLNKLVAVMPTEKTMVFIKQQNYEKDETLADVFKANKPVGYLNDDHKTLLTYIASAMGQTKPKLIKMTSVSFKDVYVIFFFRDVEHKKISFEGDIIPHVLDLGSYDINILKLHLPYCMIKNKDFKRYVDKFMNRYSIKTCITIQNVLVGDALFDEEKHSHIIKTLHEKLNDSQSMNYYASFTSNIQYIESFSNGVVNIQPLVNVDGFFNALEKTLTIYTNKVDGILLKKSDKVTLKNQVRDEENGMYNIAHVSNRLSVMKMAPFVPRIENTGANFTPKSNVDGVYDKKSNTLVLSMDKIETKPLSELEKVVLNNQTSAEQNGLYQVVRVGIKSSVLKMIERAKIQDALASEDAKFVCVGDPSKNTKAACEANKKNTWDRPCISNSECPFYQANKRYKNYRGGCIDGKCEMPIGVSVKGFRYAQNKQDVLCHGCRASDIMCCVKQNSPDYAFSLDTYDRMKEGGAQWHQSLPLAKSVSSSMSPSSFSPR